MIHVRMMKGMTLVEMVVVIGIFSLIITGITVLFVSLWQMQGFSMRLGMSSQQATYAVTKIADLVRDVRQANNGAYPIVTATDTTFTVYTNIDSDSATERVRFFRDGSTVRMGVTDPTMTVPVVYDTANETVHTIARDVVDNDDDTPLFLYYGENNSPFMVQPPLEDIRMVRITITVDTDPNVPPNGIVLSAFSSPRNLRSW